MDSEATNRVGDSSAPPLSTGQCATLACMLEVSAPKPGNVHRGADFSETTLEDFLTGAVAIGPAMETAAGARLGTTVLEAIRATKALVGTNVNLGTVLLLAPLAAVPRSESLRPGVRGVLDGLSPADARDVYAAIRLARPGGLGEVESHDVSGPPPEDLLAAMRAAAAHDMVARQYAEGFSPLFDRIVPWLQDSIARTARLPEAIVDAQLRVLSEYPDSLIGRKCGPKIARQASARAGAVLECGPADSPQYRAGLADLDFWLRSDHHRRNPGTTADLLAAALFTLLRDGKLPLSGGNGSAGRIV